MGPKERTLPNAGSASVPVALRSPGSRGDAHSSSAASGDAPPLPSGGPEAGSDKGEPEIVGRVEAILALIRPAVREDGGDIELVEVTADGMVKVRFHGACIGCPSKSITLQTGIERNLRLRVAEVTAVIAVP